ncbi:cbb3-type cytochrome oxidase assembly protein CcoS [bacterium]|nr:MAG: cbb3-type cytochrome oxidase assembly protein CcoS [bacterium]
MSLFPVAVVIVAVALVAGALALAAFFWALRSGQFSVKHMSEGALTIFDSSEPVGRPTDQTLQTPRTHPDERTGRQPSTR